ncbi:hypothetical protein, conserved [Eimeria tenella]|uniref:Dpy-30 motif protein n=1 Tax=Eimeria tenella TaxID=5802 RepID=U6L1D9_EIMTE|nr:hypothetical protein, conserved [Eimeria tenella]CDJ41580.1 hypothetical protein, conserved [Eimeria tenella]|eukprot:XP_013232330.1 hypothetical protein, conserved [Eimeria tenella]
MASTLGATSNAEEACRSEGTETVAMYLHGNVAKALAEGLAATIKAQPKDPPIFLSRWLLGFVDERQKQLKGRVPQVQRERLLSQAFVKSSRADLMKQQGERTLQGHLKRAQRDTLGLRASDTEAIEAFRAVEWVDEETIGNLLDCLKKSVGATGIYMAKYEEQTAFKDGSTNPVLRYIATDKSHTHMLGQCLREEEGITWDLFQDDESDKDAEELMKPSRGDGEDEEGEPLAEEQEEKRWTSTDTPEAEAENALKHKSVFVEEVLDNPRIYYFGLTRPGSYIAVSVEFNDVANAESVTALSKWLKDKREGEEKISFSGEKVEETSGTASSAESTDGDLNDEEEALAKESSSLGPVELHSTPAKYILCADSLGQEAAFTQSAFQCVQTFAKEIGKAFVRTQREAVERQAYERLNTSELQDEEEYFSELQQRCSVRSQELLEQLQAEALRQLDEEEAEEAAHSEMLRQEKQRWRQKKSEKKGHLEGQEGYKDNAEREERVDSESLSSGKDDEEDDETNEETSVTPPLSRQCALEAAAAQAALRAFNEEVLNQYKHRLSFRQRYIADSPGLVSAAAACALLLGHEASALKEHSKDENSQWSWNHLRRLLTPAFAEAMLKFDPSSEQFRGTLVLSQPPAYQLLLSAVYI